VFANCGHVVIKVTILFSYYGNPEPVREMRETARKSESRYLTLTCQKKLVSWWMQVSVRFSGQPNFANICGLWLFNIF
jgi:hypothetical protein